MIATSEPIDHFKTTTSLIMIVEDNLLNLQVLGYHLENAGYNIAIAHNGNQALNLLSKIAPDLILMDCSMPEIEGLTACQIIKSNPKTCDIPIVFLTGKTDAADISQAFEKGASDYITKPFTATDLLMRLKTQIELKHTKDKIKVFNTLKKDLEALLIESSDYAKELNTEVTQKFHNVLEKVSFLIKELEL